ncbi:glutamate 5-kinase [Dactylosporangium matsuzakiense]|uniref:Glutamate 5-kinase n=1 Tax=Dactylosporangium matsuzakiense TaxID=53360 RepID=A0A9W6KPL1_9ACTN|nr:glutamate 5-kinase [Dactylosporangium matsuzakiense]UWZ42815.1 glutamate 5-kinase [Dactylosporangium matsuzakiense]GLL04755.1 glutamate 5-kinase [Dactylosporangium matsuzakiense]
MVTPDEDRVVLKIGTTSLVTDGRLEPEKVERLCAAVRLGIRAGLAPVVVTSGAIAIGRTRHAALGDANGAGQQVAAAIGQGLLYGALQETFASYGLETGQVLLTPYDLIEADRGERVRATFDEMRSLGVVPIVNENDALGVRNNDVLAALLSGFLRAGLLVLLTNVPGLYDRDPQLGGKATRIGKVAELTPQLEALAGGTVVAGGTGGMQMKLSACWIATYSGVRTVIADTADPAVLVAAREGADIGTAFAPRPVRGARPDAGRLWRAFRTPPRGAVTCAPAGLIAIEHRQALRRIQVTTARGQFHAGDVVDITGPDATLLARGSIRYPASAVEFGCEPGTALLVGSDYVRIRRDAP